MDKKKSIRQARKLRRAAGKVYGDKYATHETAKTRKYRARPTPKNTLAGARSATGNPGGFMMLFGLPFRLIGAVLDAIFRSTPPSDERAN